MDMKRRRTRGFTIGKLMPFCKAVKPSQDLYNNVHYSSSTTTTSYAPHQPDFDSYVTNTTPHDLVPPKVSFLLQSSVAAPENKKTEKVISRGFNGVDARAASYISSVRERFKLDHSETVINLDGDDDH